MKKKIDVMQYADDKHVAEANPMRRFYRKSKFNMLAAAVLTFALLIGSLSILLPANQEPIIHNRPTGYLAIQSGITGYLDQHGMYARKNQANKENFWDNLLGFFGGGMTKGDMVTNGAVMDGAADIWVDKELDYVEDYYSPEAAPGADGSYVEVTDNQVEGVTEGDRFKRSSTHIFYLDCNGVLKVYTIEGLASKEVNSLHVAASVEEECALTEKICNVELKEMFLSSDAKTLTIIATFVSADGGSVYTEIINYDVSTPESIKKRASVIMTGGYLSARYIDNKLLVMSSQVIKEDELYVNGKVDFSNEKTYLPRISKVNCDLEVFSEDDIIIPEETSRLCYTNVTVRDSETLESLGDKSFFSHSTDAYVTKDRIYLTSVYAKMTEKSSSTIRDAMTDITCLKIGEGELTEEGMVTVRGYVKDQYSMDEYEGVLRVVTTTNSTEYYNSNYISYGYDDRFSIATATGRSNASLYCIDAATFEVISEVVDFAPPHEEVQSARFDKTMAYVCTSIEMSDPVFFFDLSDVNNITYKDTGTIEGYSTSLVNLKDGYLLGFGVANWRDAKVEIYEETENGVRSVCDFVVYDAEISPEHKAHYINRDENLIGFGTCRRDGSHQAEYILLGFTGDELIEIIRMETSVDADTHRATLIDDCFYILHAEGLIVKKLYD